jgi:hypothetical protein
MGYSNTILQRGYVQKEAAWGTVPNNTGTATLTGADAFLSTDLSIQDQQAIESRPDKTGSYSRVAGLPTLRSGTWSVRASLAGGGAADVPPDLGPFFEALLGKQTISAGNNVAYDPDDVDVSLSVWDFNRPSTIEQRVAPGAIVQRFVLNFGQTFADVEFSGENKCVLAKSRIATGSTEEKAGLTAFPDEPATPVTVGNAITGRKGVITLDGQAYSSLRSGSIEVTVDRELKKDTFNNDLPTGIMGGMRLAKCTLTLDDDDGANQAAMVAKAYAKTAVNFTIQLGLTAGGIFVASLKNILLPNPTYDYSTKRRGIVFSGAETAATSLTAKDEMQFQFK